MPQLDVFTVYLAIVAACLALSLVFLVDRDGPLRDRGVLQRAGGVDAPVRVLGISMDPRESVSVRVRVIASSAMGSVLVGRSRRCEGDASRLLAATPPRGPYSDGQTRVTLYTGRQRSGAGSRAGACVRTLPDARRARAPPSARPTRREVLPRQGVHDRDDRVGDRVLIDMDQVERLARHPCR